MRFSIESWDWDGWEAGHHLYKFSIGRGRVTLPNTNCFLYPQETGVILIRGVGSCQNYPDNCINSNEDSTDPPKATGMRLVGYEDLKTYTPWPDLYPDYHPEVQNLSYTVTNEGIEFNFDLPKSFFKGYGFSYTAWLMLYDENGKLISIIYNAQLEKILVDSNGLYHISGYSTSPFSSNLSYFRNSNEIDEISGWDFSHVDHVRVFAEEQHEDLCGTYTNYDIYREREEKY